MEKEMASAKNMGLFASKKGSYCQPPERRRKFPNKSRSVIRYIPRVPKISTFSPFKAPQIAQIASPDQVEIRGYAKPSTQVP
jgi:hypothetical protein